MIFQYHLIMWVEESCGSSDATCLLFWNPFDVVGVVVGGREVGPPSDRISFLGQVAPGRVGGCGTTPMLCSSSQKISPKLRSFFMTRLMEFCTGHWSIFIINFNTRHCYL